MSEIIKRIRSIGERVMAEIAEASTPCARDRHGYCHTCQAGPLDRCPSSYLTSPSDRKLDDVRDRDAAIGITEDECDCSCHTDYTRKRIKIPGSISNEAIERALERSMACSKCNCQSTLPQAKTTRRGFISMLGAGAIVLAAPKPLDLTEANIERVITDMQLENQYPYFKVTERLVHGWTDARLMAFNKVTYDAERSLFVVEGIPDRKIYSKDGVTRMDEAVKQQHLRLTDPDAWYLRT